MLREGIKNYTKKAQKSMRYNGDQHSQSDFQLLESLIECFSDDQCSVSIM